MVNSSQGQLFKKKKKVHGEGNVVAHRTELLSGIFIVFGAILTSDL